MGLILANQSALYQNSCTKICLWQRLLISIGQGANLISASNEHQHLAYFVVSKVPAKEVLLYLSQIGVCLKQLEQVYAEAQRSWPDIKFSIVLCGDFNSTPPFGVLEFMRSGQVSQTFF